MSAIANYKLLEKARLENETSARCKHQQRFGFGVGYSALILSCKLRRERALSFVIL